MGVYIQLMKRGQWRGSGYGWQLATGKWKMKPFTEENSGFEKGVFLECGDLCGFSWVGIRNHCDWSFASKLNRLITSRFSLPNLLINYQFFFYLVM